MSDLVQRLREYSNWGVSREAASMLSEAADELERLTRELEEARKDQARLNWIEQQASARKIELAKSVLGAGFEIGLWPSMKVSVTAGPLRAAIDAAMSQEK